MDISYIADKVGREIAYKIVSYYLDEPVSSIRYREHFDLPAKFVDDVIDKYKQGVPLNKIFGYEYFFGEKFIVTEDVLAPRQDTELLVDKALEMIDQGDRVLDLCSGSGCVGLSIAKNRDVSLVLCDKSEKAMNIAKRNAEALSVNAEFVISDMFDNLNGTFDCIVSNPPYIRTDVIDSLDVGVREYDPLMALDGGVDGLTFYKIIRQNFESFLALNGVLLLEIGYDQAQDILNLFDGFNVKIFKDYGGNPRVAVIKR